MGSAAGALLSIMRAVVVDPTAGPGFRLGEVPDPTPGPGDVVVDVAAFSVNFGEVHGLAERPAGAVPGWEAAGVVTRAAGDGSGPPVGTPVVTFGWEGGWASRRVVPSAQAAPVPAHVDLGLASTAAIAGLSALRSLRRLGDIAGRRVLVTGATGGVGRFAVQLARLAGALPVVTTRSPERHEAALRALGAAEVHASVADVPPGLAGVIDSVGGRTAVAGFERLAEHGTLITVGHSAGEDVVFPYPSLLGGPENHDRSLTTFFLYREPDLPPDLTWLAERVGDGTLDPGVAWRGDWADLPVATAALLDRTLAGKAVVDIGR